MVCTRYMVVASVCSMRVLISSGTFERYGTKRLMLAFLLLANRALGMRTRNDTSESGGHFNPQQYTANIH